MMLLLWRTCCIMHGTQVVRNVIVTHNSDRHLFMVQINSDRLTDVLWKDKKKQNNMMQFYVHQRNTKEG
jgi:hypothetical protein